jgi:hypothetical protein
LEVDSEFQSFESHFANGYYLCEILYKKNGIHRNNFQQDAKNDDTKLSIETNYMLIKAGLIRLHVDFVPRILEYIQNAVVDICVHLLLQLKSCSIGASFDIPSVASIWTNSVWCCCGTCPCFYPDNTFCSTCPRQ